MQTPHLKKISSLALAGMMLFSVNLSNAQDAGAKEKEKEKSKDKKKEMTCIIIYKDSDGKTIRIDTTVTNGFAFDFDGLTDFHFEMPELPELPDMAVLPMPPDPPDAPGFFYHYDDNDKLSPEEKEKLKKELEKVKEEMGKAREEMKKLNSDEFKKEMEELKEQLEKMKIEIRKEKEIYRDKNSDDKGDKKLMMYKMFKEEGNEAGLSIRKCILFSDGDTVITNCKSHPGMFDVNSDSLKMKTIIWVQDDEKVTGDAEPKIRKRIAVIAEPGEKEEAATAVAGEEKEKEELNPKVKIENSKTDANSNQLQAEDLKFYPNPTDGNFSLSFRLNTTGKTIIRLLDAVGKEIFNETIENFTGEYNRLFDITGKSKGAYLLMISQGDKWLHKKIVLK